MKTSEEHKITLAESFEEHKITLAEALCNAQSVMTAAKKDKKNPFFNSSYTSLASVFESINQPFTKNGLSITQIMDVLENGRTVLITKLMHVNGESIESKMLLPDILDPQKIGSAITYFRRYSLMAIAGLPADDDDGNSACKAQQAQYKPPVIQKIKNINISDWYMSQEEFYDLEELQDYVCTCMDKMSKDEQTVVNLLGNLDTKKLFEGFEKWKKLKDKS